jgi:hypothetical protein
MLTNHTLFIREPIVTKTDQIMIVMENTQIYTHCLVWRIPIHFLLKMVHINYKANGLAWAGITKATAMREECETCEVRLSVVVGRR